MIQCPNCKSQKVRLSDHMPLEIELRDTFPPSIDTELYADAKCDDCELTFQLLGEITFKVR